MTCDGSVDGAESWAVVPQRLREGRERLPAPWEEIFGPLRAGAVDDLMVLGQVGQSLDGRIATAKGHSHYINGAAGLAHLHRLRAVCDAVVVGCGTVLVDDPQLTVRRVAGPNPARVVLDPRGRLPLHARVLAEDGVRRLVIMAEGAAAALPAGVELVRLPAREGRMEPAAILAALAERGLRRILIEGGAETVSRFLAAGCLDRLHIMISPIILGDGRASFRLPPVERLDEALRVPMRAHPLDGEILLDCDLSAQRRPVGQAKKST